MKKFMLIIILCFVAAVSGAAATISNSLDPPHAIALESNDNSGLEITNCKKSSFVSCIKNLNKRSQILSAQHDQILARIKLLESK